MPVAFTKVKFCREVDADRTRLPRVALVANRFVEVAFVDVASTIVREEPLKLKALTLPSKTALPFLSRVIFVASIVTALLPPFKAILPLAEKLPVPRLPNEPLLPITELNDSRPPLTEIFLLTLKLPLILASLARVTKDSKYAGPKTSRACLNSALPNTLSFPPTSRLESSLVAPRINSVCPISTLPCNSTFSAVILPLAVTNARVKSVELAPPKNSAFKFLTKVFESTTIGAIP